jgi:hypothetical protein
MRAFVPKLRQNTAILLLVLTVSCAAAAALGPVVRCSAGGVLAASVNLSTLLAGERVRLVRGAGGGADAHKRGEELRLAHLGGHTSSVFLNSRYVLKVASGPFCSRLPRTN